jgi:transcriptional regulator with XRE-family HTH domain
VTTFSFHTISPRRKSQLRLLGGLHTQLANALQAERLKRGLTRLKIAELLGWDKAALTRKLKNSANITLETLADLSYALDREALVFLVPKHRAQEIKNHVSFILMETAEENRHAQSAPDWVNLSSGTEQNEVLTRQNEPAGESAATYRVLSSRDSTVSPASHLRLVA